MKFPLMFTRVKPPAATFKTLGDDALLVDANSLPRRAATTDDNTLALRIVSINGWPLQRVVLYGLYTGVGMPIALPTTLYVFEENLGVWLEVPGSASSITPGTATAPGLPTFYDPMALIDFPHVQADLDAVAPGAATFLVIVSDPGGAPDGTYQFILGGELSSKPF
jgi:hypothetical protein